MIYFLSYGASALVELPFQLGSTSEVQILIQMEKGKAPAAYAAGAKIHINLYRSDRGRE